MELNLVSLVEKQQSLHPLKLIDKTLHLGPEKKSISSMYLAWVWDWALSLFITASLVGAWTEFLTPLVFDFVSLEMEMAFIGSTTALIWIVAPMIHFAHTSLGLLNGGQTFGMKAFKHIVMDEDQSITTKQALLWSAGSTVSIMTAGATTFWMDHLVSTQTISQSYYFWCFTNSTITELVAVPELVKHLEIINEETEYSQAA